MTTYYISSVNPAASDGNAGTSSSAPKRCAGANAIKALAASGNILNLEGYWNNQDFQLSSMSGLQILPYGSGVTLDYRRELKSGGSAPWGWTHIGSSVWKRTTTGSPNSIGRVIMGSLNPLFTPMTTIHGIFSEGTDVAKRVVDQSGGSLDAKVIATIGSGVFATPNRMYAWYWDKATATMYVRGDSTTVDPWTRYGGIWATDWDPGNALSQFGFKFTAMTSFNIGAINILGGSMCVGFDGGNGTWSAKQSHGNYYQPSMVIMGGHSAINGLTIDQARIALDRPFFEEHNEMAHTGGDDGNGIKENGGQDQVQVLGNITSLTIQRSETEGQAHGAICLQFFGDFYFGSSMSGPTFTNILVQNHHFDLRNTRYGRAIGSFGTRSQCGSIIFQDFTVTGQNVRSQIGSANTTVRRGQWRDGRNGAMASYTDKYTGNPITRNDIGDAIQLFGSSFGEIDNIWIEDNVFYNTFSNPMSSSNYDGTYWNANNCGFRRNVSIKGSQPGLMAGANGVLWRIETSGADFVAQNNRQDGYTIGRGFKDGQAFGNFNIGTMNRESGTTGLSGAEIVLYTAAARAETVSLGSVTAAPSAGSSQDVAMNIKDIYGANVQGWQSGTIVTSDATKATGALLGATDSSGNANIRITGVAGGSVSISIDPTYGRLIAPTIATDVGTSTAFTVERVIDCMTKPNVPTGVYPSFSAVNFYPSQSVTDPNNMMGADIYGNPTTLSSAVVGRKIRSADLLITGDGYTKNGTLDDTGQADGTTLKVQPLFQLNDSWQSGGNTSTDGRIQWRNFVHMELSTGGVWSTISTDAMTTTDLGQYVFPETSLVGAALTAGSGLGNIRDETSNGGGISLGNVCKGVTVDGNSKKQYDSYIYENRTSMAGSSRTKGTFKSSVKGTLIFIEARQIEHTVGGTDDRNLQNVLINVGADWYVGATNLGPYFRSNWQEVDNNWTMFAATDIPAADLINNPPPGFTTSSSAPTGNVTLINASAKWQFAWDADSVFDLTVTPKPVAGTTVVVMFAGYQTSGVTVTDNQGNGTYTSGYNQSPVTSSADRNEIQYKANVGLSNPGADFNLHFVYSNPGGTTLGGVTVQLGNVDPTNPVRSYGLDGQNPYVNSPWSVSTDTNVGGGGNPAVGDMSLLIESCTSSAASMGFAAIGAPWSLIDLENDSSNYQPYMASYHAVTAAGHQSVSLPALNPTGMVERTSVHLVFRAAAAAPVLTSPTISNTLVPPVARGAAYTMNFVAGGTPPIVWDIQGFPTGITANNSTGAVSGTTNVLAGDYTITAKATNAQGSVTKTFTFTVTGTAPNITTITPPTGYVGTFFTYQLASDAVDTVTWSAITALPAGLVLNTTTGVISGTPTATFATTSSIRATNSGGSDTEAIPFSIVAGPPPSGATVTSSNPLPNGTVGVAYSYTVTKSGSGTVTLAASALPAGLSMSSGGAITGTPTVAGATTVTITPTSSTTGVGTPRDYSLTINPPAATQSTGAWAFHIQKGPGK